MAGVDFFHHLVDLFERKAFGFGLEGVSLWSMLMARWWDSRLGSRQRR